jgi:cell division protein FtsW (lipid II flippase)
MYIAMASSTYMVLSSIDRYLVKKELRMNSAAIRIVIGGALGFFFAFIISLINEIDLWVAFINGLWFAIFIMVIVIVLNWAARISEKKGYDQWVGIGLVLLLNVVGAAILLFLPAHKQDKN